MSNFEIHELTEKAINRNSNIIHDTLYGGDYETGKNLAGAVADLASANVAAAYDSATTYAIGQYCLYEGDIYRCIAITTGAFDSTAWTQIVVTGEFRRVVELTSSQYSALSSAEKNNGTLYILTDEETTAADIPYSAGVSVADKLDDINEKIALETLTNKITPAQGVTLEIISFYKQGNMAIISFVLRIPNISGTILTFTDIFPIATAYNTVKDNDNVVPYLKIERTSTGGRLATDVTKTTNGLVIGEIIFFVD